MATDFGTPFARRTRPVVMGRHAGIVTGHHLASQIAYDALRAGGNAVDAAIAAAAALAVLKPDACGLGSDLFLLYGEHGSGETYALNASGPAPKRALPQSMAEGRIPIRGIGASTVPGAVEGWQRAVNRFGRRTLAQALTPAIALARNGMPVSQLFAATLTRNEAALRQVPSTAEVFYPQVDTFKAGDVLVQNDAAETLEAIAESGAAAFYRGDFAHSLDAYSRQHGGFLRALDLESYESEWLRPLRVAYSGMELVASPPVSVGIVVLEALKLLDSTVCGQYDDVGADFIHVQAESMKLAISDQLEYLGDPHYARADITSRMMDDVYISARAQGIDRSRVHAVRAGDLFANVATDTSYVGVIDGEGNAVSLLQSVFHVFGSGEVIPRTGCLMNNRMAAFSLDPESPNVLAPGKRPMHTLNPLLVLLHGEPYMCLGTPGGPSQVHTNAQLLYRVLNKRLDLQSAIDAPRWFCSLQNALHIESSVDADVLTNLAMRGHEIFPMPPLSAAMGGAGIVRINPLGVREAAADQRRESYALAF